MFMINKLSITRLEIFKLILRAILATTTYMRVMARMLNAFAND
jgi:hypothetical protein